MFYILIIHLSSFTAFKLNGCGGCDEPKKLAMPLICSVYFAIPCILAGRLLKQSNVPVMHDVASESEIH